jgi:hypothetical protein
MTNCRPAMRHTHGPWTRHDSFGRVTDGEAVEIWAGDVFLATVHFPGDFLSDEEPNANAALISAAPDLLEALKLLLEYDRWPKEDAEYLEWRLEAARKAVTKATRQSM